VGTREGKIVSVAEVLREVEAVGEKKLGAIFLWANGEEAKVCPMPLADDRKAKEGGRRDMQRSS
jgi:hypothetical protein